MLKALLIADASTLLNFLRVRRFDLVQGLGYRVLVVDAVYEEVKSEREHLDELIAREAIELYVTEGTAVTERAAVFVGLGLGSGESFSVAAAAEASALLALDDRRARSLAVKSEPGLTFISSAEIVLEAIASGRMTVAEADRLKDDWGQNHRFKLKFGSFAELLRSMR